MMQEALFYGFSLERYVPDKLPASQDRPVRRSFGLRVARRMKEGIVGGEAFAVRSFFLAASDGGEHQSYGSQNSHLASLLPIKMRQVWKPCPQFAGRDLLVTLEKVHAISFNAGGQLRLEFRFNQSGVGVDVSASSTLAMCATNSRTALRRLGC